MSSRNSLSLAIESDRISDLHEDIISHILSRLPTKDAIRTSILSKDWKYKWTSFYNVDIEEGKLCTLGKFYDITNRILALSKHLTSFRLICWSHMHDLNLLQEWVSTVLRHNIESFDLVYYKTTGIFVYQVNILNSISLRKLKLDHISSIFNVAAMNCAPNLTNLYLSGVEIVNESYNPPNSTSITFNFPVLKTFEAEWIIFSAVSCVEIYAPLLSEFSIGSDYIYDKEFDYSIVLVTPKLTTFKHNGVVPKKFILKYGSSIHSASLLSEAETDEVSPRNFGLQVGELLNGFINMEDLKLSSFMAEVLLFGPPLHRLDKVKKLTFVFPITTQQPLELLKAFPTLEFLSINTCDLEAYDYGAIKSVPSCIISHLREIEFIDFLCEEPYYNLANFFLENGEMLNKISIVCPIGEFKPVKVRKYLSTLLKFRPRLRVDIN